VAALVVGFLVGWGKPLKITGVAQAFLADFLSVPEISANTG
jgi:hypothetical protein